MRPWQLHWLLFLCSLLATKLGDCSTWTWHPGALCISPHRKEEVSLGERGLSVPTLALHPAGAQSVVLLAHFLLPQKVPCVMRNYSPTAGLLFSRLETPRTLRMLLWHKAILSWAIWNFLPHWPTKVAISYDSTWGKLATNHLSLLLLRQRPILWVWQTCLSAQLFSHQRSHLTLQPYQVAYY